MSIPGEGITTAGRGPRCSTWPKCSGSAESPKSEIFTRPSPSRRMFSGLMSLWHTPRSWQYATPSMSCWKKVRASSSVRRAAGARGGGLA